LRSGSAREAMKNKEERMADEKAGDRSPAIHGWSLPSPDDIAGGPSYAAMIDALRTMLDTLAAARPDEATIVALGDDIAAWSRRLAPFAVDEWRQIFARRVDLAGRGQTMIPLITYGPEDAQTLQASVAFGRYFLGGNGAAHGGAVALMFDEVLGRLANVERSVARTAYLHTDFRSITPIETKLDISARFVSEEGRKRLVRAELRNGEIVCAEAEGLFLALKPGQP
jgi:acyl-coenzyme A thioesterase PaaI-like protein